MPEQNTMEAVLALRKGESLLLAISEEDSADLWLAMLEKTSLENLVISYVQSFGQPEGNLRFEEIYERYLQVQARLFGCINHTIRTLFDEESCAILTDPANGFSIEYDNRMLSLRITKHCPAPCFLKQGSGSLVSL